MKYIIAPSKFKGISVFSKVKILKDELIDVYYKNHPNDRYTKNIFGWFDRNLGRYCNHSFNPNTYVKESPNKDGYDLYALTNIEIGEEILVNYVFMEQLTNAPKNSFYKPHFNEEKQTFIIKNIL